MPPQHPLLAVVDERIEDAVAREQLARVLLDPQPRAHLQRERQEGVRGHLAAGLQVQVVPQVAVGKVLRALRLDDVLVVAVRLQKNVLQRMQLGQVRNGPAGVGKREPQPVLHPKARVAVQRNAERPRQQLLRHHIAQRLALGLHGLAQPAPVPGQARAHALPTNTPGYRVHRIDGRIAHQVHPARVGTRGRPHAAGVDDGHEDQAHPLQLLVQGGVPLQPHDHVLQVGNDHLGTNALQPMHAAKEPHRRHVQRRVAQPDGVDGQMRPRCHSHLLDDLHLQMRRPQVEDFSQRRKLGQHVQCVG